MKNKQIKPIKKITPITKIALIFVLIISCLTLTACDPGSNYFTHEALSDVVSVELINYDNPAQKHFVSWVPDHTSDLKPFDDSKLSVLETLDKNRIPDFIDALCKFDILDTYYTSDSPGGLSIKLTYSNGDFLIISSNYKINKFEGYIGKFTADGAVKKFIGCFSSSEYFKALVNDYFQMQI